MCQDFPFKAKLLVLASQTSKLLAFGRGQPVLATALVQISLFEPIPDGLRRGLELAGQFLGAAASSNQLDDLLPVFRRIRWMRSPHRGLLPHKHNGVHATGSTPISLRLPPRCQQVFGDPKRGKPFSLVHDLRSTTSTPERRDCWLCVKEDLVKQGLRFEKGAWD